MSHSFKHHPGGPVANVGAGEGRLVRRAFAKRERAAAAEAMTRKLSVDANFHFTEPIGWNLGDGKVGFNHFADAKYMRK